MCHKPHVPVYVTLCHLRYAQIRHTCIWASLYRYTSVVVSDTILAHEQCSVSSSMTVQRGIYQIRVADRRAVTSVGCKEVAPENRTQYRSVKVAVKRTGMWRVLNGNPRRCFITDHKNGNVLRIFLSDLRCSVVLQKYLYDKTLTSTGALSAAFTSITIILWNHLLLSKTRKKMRLVWDFAAIA